MQNIVLRIEQDVKQKNITRKKIISKWQEIYSILSKMKIEEKIYTVKEVEGCK
jgi:hypothetical protein